MQLCRCVSVGEMCFLGGCLVATWKHQMRLKRETLPGIIWLISWTCVMIWNIYLSHETEESQQLTTLMRSLQINQLWNQKLGLLICSSQTTVMVALIHVFPVKSVPPYFKNYRVTVSVSEWYPVPHFSVRLDLSCLVAFVFFWFFSSLFSSPLILF